MKTKSIVAGVVTGAAAFGLCSYVAYRRNIKLRERNISSVYEDDSSLLKPESLNIDTFRTKYFLDVEDFVKRLIIKTNENFLDGLNRQEQEALEYLFRALIGFIYEEACYEEKNFLMLRHMISFIGEDVPEDGIDIFFQEEKNNAWHEGMEEYVRCYEHYKAICRLCGKDRVAATALLIADSIVEELYGGHAYFAFTRSLLERLPKKETKDDVDDLLKDISNYEQEV